MNVREAGLQGVTISAQRQCGIPSDQSGQAPKQNDYRIEHLSPAFVGNSMFRSQS
jgi:hypothetical protein